MLRIWRWPYSHFGRNDLLDAPKVYTAEVLRQIAAAGFNAIWIRGILRDLAPTRVFPEFGRQGAALRRSLRTVIRRASRAGLRVYLYMQPPLGLPERHPFWRRHPDVQGATYDFFGQRISAMCVSAEPVRRFLREAAQRLSEQCPGLGGLIVITASEFISHCYSHYGEPGDPPWSKPRGQPIGCPRCEARQPRDVVADILASLHEGLTAAGRGARLIAWNWSWSFYEPDPAVGIIRRLPRGVILMADFERGGTKTILGQRRLIDEYSLSYPGPSPRFLKTWRAARARGIPVMAKLQIGTTHELATVPNLPLVGSLYEKARALRRLGVTDFMGCWNFGNMLSMNTAALVHFLEARPLAPRRTALSRFAAEYFPGCRPADVVRAWNGFAQAMNHYPFCIPFLYYGPTNFALQLPLRPGPLDGRPVGRSWLPDRRGDELVESIGQPFTLREIIAGLGRLTRQWFQAVAWLRQGLAGSDSVHAQEEQRTAEVIGHCFRSTWNVYRAYRLRRRWKPVHMKALKAILRDERDHLRAVLPLVAADRRYGFHSECQYRMFSPAGIRRKLKAIDELLR